LNACSLADLLAAVSATMVSSRIAVARCDSGCWTLEQGDSEALVGRPAAGLGDQGRYSMLSIQVKIFMMENLLVLVDE